MVIQHSDVTKTSRTEAIIKLKQNVQNINGNDSLRFLNAAGGGDLPRPPPAPDRDRSSAHSEPRAHSLLQSSHPLPFRCHTLSPSHACTRRVWQAHRASARRHLTVERGCLRARSSDSQGSLWPAVVSREGRPRPEAQIF